jgi:hypothetical protein
MQECLAGLPSRYRLGYQPCPNHCQWTVEVTVARDRHALPLLMVGILSQLTSGILIFERLCGFTALCDGCEALRLDVARSGTARSESSSTATTAFYNNDSVENIARHHTCGSVLSQMRRGQPLDYPVTSTTNPRGVARNASQQAPFSIIDPPPPTVRHAALLDGISLRSPLHCIDWDMIFMHQLRTNNRHGP